MNLLIAVPAYRGEIKSQTAFSLVNLCLFLQASGTKFRTMSISRASIADARNFFASFALQQKFTHLLFIDSDVVFKPESILRLMRAGKDVIACAVPLREQGRTNSSPTTPDGIHRVEYIGTAIMLISLGALQKLAPRVQCWPKHDIPSLAGPLYGFFDEIRSADGRLGEDGSFCKRWREVGEVFALSGEPIGHLDNCEYRLGQSLSVGDKATAGCRHGGV